MVGRTELLIFVRRISYILFFLPLVGVCELGDEVYLPSGFLNKPIGEVVGEFSVIAEDRNFIDEDDNGKKEELLLVIWRKYYLGLYLSDNVIVGLSIIDHRMKTKRNVRVGATFSDVQLAYPEAEFKSIYDYKYRSSDGYTLLFGFDTKSLAYDMKPLNHDKLQGLVLSVIRLSN